jgi:hypothetical protein
MNLLWTKTPMKKLVWFASALAATSLSCVNTVNIPETCNNNIDDDENGQLDCADEQCVGTPECTEVCNNGLDEDVDGNADCADDDCDGALNCILGSSEICNNGSDDDGDGKIDCQDESCAIAANCVQNLGENCNNGADDDNDGQADCQDTDCFSAPNCELVFTENCNSGADEDLDGQIDCQDPDCVNAANCIQNPTELCTGNIDEDNDGLTDCADPDCAANPACVVSGCDPNNDQCTGNDICVIDDCVPAFGRTYLVSNLVVSLDSTNANSDDWDFGSNPDIKVEVHLNDVKLLQTQEITPPLTNGRFNATYSESVLLTINSGDKLELRVLDVDLDADDLALSCVLDPISTDLLRGRDLFCQTSDGITAFLDFSINPQ